MAEFVNPIIPSQPRYCGPKDQIDLRAVCAFTALGFFLGSDTYWVGRKMAPVASICEIGEDGTLISARPYFAWHYQPRHRSLSEVVDEFAMLFETVIGEQVPMQRVILPLSGGLDSRSQAAALKKNGANVTAFSYNFRNGHDEASYAKKVAAAQGFPIKHWTVEPGYLWNSVDDLARINGCYSDFTHPRQMAFVKYYSDLGDVFSLGHWGDVLFDDMGVEDNLPHAEQVEEVLRKVVKKGGFELATALWEAWGIEGEFREYITDRIDALLRAIDIPHSANAKIRAFKSIHWAPRWTSVNLSVFASARPVTLPYYDNRICEFICSVPERYLSGRKIQIEYIKRRAPELAKITWQDHRPFDLTNYEWDRFPWNLPMRIYNKARRTMSYKGPVQRNWELQFLGEANDRELRSRLLEEPSLSDWVPRSLITDFYRRFRFTDRVRYSHSVSMLLTLSLFSKHFKSPASEDLPLVRGASELSQTALQC